MNCTHFPLPTYPKFVISNYAEKPYDPEIYTHSHNFGLHVHPDYRRHAARPGQPRLAAPPLFTENGFQVSLDVSEFYPREVSVRTVQLTRTIVVEGDHEPRNEMGSDVERYFRREFDMPEDIDLESVVVAFSADGILTIRAHKKSEKNERTVPILTTGPAHLWVKRVRHQA